MTIEAARRVIETAREHDPKSVDVAELTTAMRVLGQQLETLFDETQRESARWLAATGDRSVASLLQTVLPLPVFDAINPSQWAPRFESAPDEDVASLIRAAGMLLEWFIATFELLKYYRTRWDNVTTEVQRRRVEGNELAGRDEGDRWRYTLNGDLLTEGVTLWLLTGAGWIRGIYHTWSEDPFFRFRLPGAAEHELEIPIPPGALLAWHVE